MPLGLGYIASTLKKYTDHAVFIVDLSHKKLDFDRISSFIYENKIDIVGISSVVANYLFCVDFTKYIKKEFPNLFIVMGGALPTTLPDIILEYCCVDVVVRGPGEVIIIDIVSNIDTYKSKSPCIISGRMPKTIDEIPWPDWEAMDYQSYDYLPPWSDFPILSSRGCPFHCNYCYKINGNLYIERSIDDLFAEVCHVVENLGMRHFMLQDDLFFLNHKRVGLFCGKIIEANLPIDWSAISRIDLLNEETIYLLKKSGCRALGIGIESGSDNMLKEMNKRLSLKKSTENIKLLHTYGIKVMPYIIVGYPGENSETLLQTEEFLIENRLYSAMTYAFPFPGTKLWQIAESRGMIKDIREYLSRSSFSVSTMHYNFTEMPDDEFIRNIEGMRKRVLFEYLSNNLKYLHSNTNYDSIYIYGAGYLGKGLYDFIISSGVNPSRIKSFIDDDSRRSGIGYRGTPVITLKESKMTEKDICFVANNYFADVMYEKIRKTGKDNNIVTLT